MGRTPSTTHRWLFCRALHLTPSDKKFGCGANIGRVCPSRKKLGLALGKFYFETTETTETKETTAKQSIIIMIINFSALSALSALSAVPVVPVVPALALIAKFTFQFASLTLP